uniref:Family with sequence similarity 168 member A n=1 Tax=Pipistrellus kuhlii TaxID=59472 RepID=A0A7J7WZS1_PIPKU|nr:family with sequence similarity 168 member A [Pipistrellus kuhlii]
MNPVYSPVQPGAPYGNPKNMAYTGYPTAYPAAAPAYNPSLYPTNSPSYAPEFQFLHSAYVIPTSRTYEASSFTFFKLSFESAWQVSVNFFQTGPHLCFTPTQQLC